MIPHLTTVHWYGRFVQKKSNNLINKVHVKALRKKYLRPKASLDELLAIENKCKIHDRNIKKLITEVYKALNYQCPDFIQQLFPRKENDLNLRDNDNLKMPKCKKEVGYQSILFRGPLIWK